MSASFHFGFAGGMCDLVVLIPGHCLSTYFTAPTSLNLKMLVCLMIGRMDESINFLIDTSKLKDLDSKPSEKVVYQFDVNYS